MRGWRESTASGAGAVLADDQSTGRLSRAGEYRVRTWDRRAEWIHPELPCLSWQPLGRFATAGRLEKQISRYHCVTLPWSARGRILSDAAIVNLEVLCGSTFQSRHMCPSMWSTVRGQRKDVPAPRCDMGQFGQLSRRHLIWSRGHSLRHPNLTVYEDLCRQGLMHS